MIKRSLNISLLTGLILALIATSFASTAFARDNAKDVKAARSLPEVRGGIVFKSYCVICHGEIGDGIARATKLYGPEKLIIGSMSAEAYEEIVRKGGAAVGRSEYMPPWQDELSEEQINDVVAYLSLVSDSVRRGEVVYKTNCVLCHGLKGDGKGRASVLYDPKPSDLVHSDKNSQYKLAIVTEGGEYMGRSPIMPPWGLQLTEQEIKDVVVYIDTLLKSE